mmetsp:Transcript_6115/g.25613  ORF Transcript_6115/g.25613 Transcript_6115/m.25613 type:complete len:456 (+) Transcript_6115:1279-2646(+)
MRSARWCSGRVWWSRRAAPRGSEEMMEPMPIEGVSSRVRRRSCGSESRHPGGLEVGGPVTDEEGFHPAIRGGLDDDDDVDVVVVVLGYVQEEEICSRAGPFERAPRTGRARRCRRRSSSSSERGGGEDGLRDPARRGLGPAGRRRRPRGVVARRRIVGEDLPRRNMRGRRAFVATILLLRSSSNSRIRRRQAQPQHATRAGDEQCVRQRDARREEHPPRQSRPARPRVQTRVVHEHRVRRGAAVRRAAHDVEPVADDRRSRRAPRRRHLGAEPPRAGRGVVELRRAENPFPVLAAGDHSPRAVEERAVRRETRRVRHGLLLGEADQLSPHQHLAARARRRARGLPRRLLVEAMSHRFSRSVVMIIIRRGVVIIIILVAIVVVVVRDLLGGREAACDEDAATCQARGGPGARDAQTRHDVVPHRAAGSVDRQTRRRREPVLQGAADDERHGLIKGR